MGSIDFGDVRSDDPQRSGRGVLAYSQASAKFRTARRATSDAAKASSGESAHLRQDLRQFSVMKCTFLLHSPIAAHEEQALVSCVSWHFSTSESSSTAALAASMNGDSVPQQGGDDGAETQRRVRWSMERPGLNRASADDATPRAAAPSFRTHPPTDDVAID